MFTAAVPDSGTGPQSKPAFPIRSVKWLWHTPLAIRLKPLTGALFCLRNGASSWKRGRRLSPRNHEIRPRIPSLSKRLAAHPSLKRFFRQIAMGLKAPRGYSRLTSPSRAICNRVYDRRSWPVKSAIGWIAAVYLSWPNGIPHCHDGMRSR